MIINTAQIALITSLTGEMIQEAPPRPETGFNVQERLLQARILVLGSQVNDTVANQLVASFLYLDAQDPTSDIKLFINSPGGSVTAGMAIYDTMQQVRADVCTICFGLAASMGAFLLAAGAPGKRFSMPSSRIMIHQPLGGAQGQAIDIEIQAREILYHKRRLNELLAHHTRQPFERIEADTDRDFFMSAEEARDYGLIDHVLTRDTLYPAAV
jgi:ATP-dependent Clp protease protease subunit